MGELNFVTILYKADLVYLMPINAG